MLRVRIGNGGHSQSGQSLAQALRDCPNPNNLELVWGYVPQAITPAQITNPIKHNAIEQLERLTAAEIPCPKFTTTQPAVGNADGWWGRQLTHTQGRDIRTCRDRSGRFARSDFWVKQIPANAIVEEWRVHVFNKKAIGRGKKVYQPDQATQLRTRRRQHLVEVVRSRRNGWKLDHSQDCPNGLRLWAKKAVEACGYLWGAVDMLVVQPTPEVMEAANLTQPIVDFNQRNNFVNCVVLEINQMPGMDPYTCGVYTKAIQNYTQSYEPTNQTDQN